MTILLYQKDSYLKTFDADVVSVNSDQNSVILTRTAFYPGGGGQPNDLGWLTYDSQTLQVVDVKKADGKVLHIMHPAATLPEPGSVVYGQVDWDRRFQLMRTHTAMHILCGVVFRDYDAQVTGGNMEPLQGRMDFEFETMQQGLVAEIEAAINAEVAASRPISVRILPRAEAFEIPDLIRTKINLLPEGIPEVRVVEIEGLDLQADGGMHVANTAEVGRMTISDYKSKGKINKRIYLQLEEAA